jgi:hypothetical protein
VAFVPEPEDEYNSAVIMDPDLSAALRRFRNAYAYPAAHISTRAMLAPPPEGLDLGHGIFGVLQPAIDGTVTDLALDAYHGSLLRSIASADTFLGCASVVFWGFRTYGARFALARVRRFAGLAPPQVGATPAMTKLALDRAFAAVASRDWGDAIGRLARH